MRVGIQVPHTGHFPDVAREIVELERLGLDVAFVPEAYTFDAVSQLGYLAAVTARVQLASAILPIYSRTPALLAMTAAGLDAVSKGRFMLGIGASGPQVVEGFHGVKYDAPVGRTREIVEICRKVWRREPLEYGGSHYEVPLPPDQGTGTGKPMKLINRPVRSQIPVMIAGTGPRNVALAAEIAQAWEPIFFHPERSADVWGAALKAGLSERSVDLGPLDIVINVPVAVVEADVEASRDRARGQLALYIGGMGARGRNFYNDLACRYGYEAEAARIQDLYLDGKKREAEAAVPEDLLRATTLIGPPGYIKERLAAFAEAGVTTVSVQPLDDSPQARRDAVEAILELAP